MAFLSPQSLGSSSSQIQLDRPSELQCRTIRVVMKTLGWAGRKGNIGGVVMVGKASLGTPALGPLRRAAQSLPYLFYLDWCFCLFLMPRVKLRLRDGIAGEQWQRQASIYRPAWHERFRGAVKATQIPGGWGPRRRPFFLRHMWEV